jgi:hypothetical protein
VSLDVAVLLLNIRRPEQDPGDRRIVRQLAAASSGTAFCPAIKARTATGPDVSPDASGQELSNCHNSDPPISTHSQSLLIRNSPQVDTRETASVPPPRLAAKDLPSAPTVGWVARGRRTRWRAVNTPRQARRLRELRGVHLERHAALLSGGPIDAAESGELLGRPGSA